MIKNEIQKVLNNEYSNEYVIKMKMLEVLFLADELLEKHSLKHIPVVLRNHFGALGKCSSDNNFISLQISHVINNDIEEIKNTILHEIAHALVGCEHGHNKIWQQKAIEIGVKLKKLKQ